MKQPTLSASLKSNACSFLRVPPSTSPPMHTHSAASPTSACPRPSVHFSLYLLPFDGIVLPRKPDDYSISTFPSTFQESQYLIVGKNGVVFKFCGYFPSALRSWELGHQVLVFQVCRAAGIHFPESPTSHIPPRSRCPPPRVDSSLVLPKRIPRASHCLCSTVPAVTVTSA